MKSPGIYRALFSGFAKTGGWFVASRLFGLAAATWATRILIPFDYTILASVFAVQGISERFTSLPMTASLVRVNVIGDGELEVAWTYELIRGLLLTAIVAGIAPGVAGLMHQPEIIRPLQIASLGFLIGGFRCPRIVELRREGRFGVLGFLDSTPAIVYAFSVLLILLFEKSFWALVYAGLISKAVSIALGYAVLPWRPSLSLNWRLAKPMVLFCVVLLGNTISAALRENGMVFLLALKGLGDQLGYYNRGVAFSLTLGLQAVVVFWRVAFPLLSKHCNEGGDPYRVATRLSMLVLVIGLPLGAVVVAMGDWLIPAVLGVKWMPIVPLWRWLVIGSVIALSSAPLAAVMQATHREKQGMMVGFLVTAVHLTISTLLIPYFGLKGVGIGFVVSAVAGQVILQWLVLWNRASATSPHHPCKL